MVAPFIWPGTDRALHHVLSITKKADLSKLVIRRIANFFAPTNLFERDRPSASRVGPYFGLIVGDRCDRHSSGPFLFI